MESVLARVHKELTIVEDRSVADVTVLGWVDRDVPVLLMTSLRAKKLSVLRVLLNLTSEVFDFLFIVIETVA